MKLRTGTVWTVLSLLLVLSLILAACAPAAAPADAGSAAASDAEAAPAAMAPEAPGTDSALITVGRPVSPRSTRMVPARTSTPPAAPGALVATVPPLLSWSWPVSP